MGVPRIMSPEFRKGNRNKATLAVARKLFAYMLSVKRTGKGFEYVETQKAA